MTNSTSVNEQDLKRHLGLFGLVIFCIYYLADVLLDVILFGEGTFTQQLLHPDLHELCIRLLAGLFLAIVLSYCWHLLQRARQAEMNLRETNTSLRHANRDLGMFSHSLAHDLKTPLSGLAVATEVLAGVDTIDSDDTKVTIAMIQKSVDRMDGTINALLKLADIELQSTKQQQVDLSKITQAALEQKQQEEPQRQIYFHITPALIVQGDLEMLSLAMDNLVDNALKYTAGQETTEVSFGLVKKGKSMVFCLEDNGCGFPEEASRRIFQPFIREHGDSYPGTGVGLATVQRIIERHNGQVWAEGSPGKGARFFFSLPANP